MDAAMPRIGKGKVALSQAGPPRRGWDKGDSKVSEVSRAWFKFGFKK